MSELNHRTASDHRTAVSAIDISATGPSTAPPMRASDADRQQAVHVLQDAIARGLLNPVEGSERMAAAFAAVHRIDLGPLTADLPQLPGTRPGGGGALLVMFLEQLRSTLRAAITGPGRAARIGAALLVVFLLISSGLILAHAMFDHAREMGGHPDYFHHP